MNTVLFSLGTVLLAATTVSGYVLAHAIPIASVHPRPALHTMPPLENIWALKTRL